MSPCFSRAYSKQYSEGLRAQVFCLGRIFLHRLFLLCGMAELSRECRAEMQTVREWNETASVRVLLEVDQRWNQ